MSQLIYVEATHFQKQEDVIRSTENCIHFYGGVPKAIVPDCMKTAVIKANKYEPELNPMLADFARHYDAVIFPTRPASPRDKSLVENAVRIVYQRIFAPLRNQKFYSIEELNSSIKEELVSLNDKPMQKLKVSRLRVLNQKDKERTNSFMWVIATKNCVLYMHRETRGAEFLREYLEDFKGSVTTDGYES